MRIRNYFLTFIILFSISCKKENNVVNNNSIGIKGIVDLNGLDYKNINIVSEIESSNTNINGEFNIIPHSVLLVKNSTINKPIYFALIGSDETTNFNIDAKQTALYFSLISIMNIRKDYYKPALKNIKKAIYEFDKVKELEIAIKNCIYSKGYLDYDILGIKIGEAVDQILNSIDAEKITFSPLRINYNSTYDALGGFYRVDSTLPNGWNDIYNSSTNSYIIRREIFNSTASIVGIKIGKYNSMSNACDTSGSYVGLIEPYYPPELLSINGQLQNLQSFLNVNYDILTNGWSGFLNSDAYSTGNELQFEIKQNQKDAIIFMNGYYDKNIIAINIAYLFLDNYANIFEDVTGKELFNDKTIKPFLIYLLTNGSTLTDLNNYYLWFKNKDYVSIINSLREYFLIYLQNYPITSNGNSFEDFKNLVDENFENLAGSVAVVYKNSILISKILSNVVINSSPKYARCLPIEFDNILQPPPPTNPNPYNVTLTNTNNINFSWSVGNYTLNDIKYNLYLSNNISNLGSSPISTNIISKNYTYSNNLLANTRYFWQIEVVHNNGRRTLGPVWMFDNGNVTQSNRGLMLYLPLNGIANDVSGNNNNGIMYGNPIFTADRDGNVSGAIEFDGIDDYISINNSSTLSLSNAITISTWLYLNSAPTEMRVIDKCPVSSSNGYLLDIGQGIGQTKVRFIGNGQNYLSNSNYIQQGVWTHIATTFDGQYVKFYINGQLDATYQSNGTLSNVSNPVLIGISQNQTNCNCNRFKGKIDDVKIYNRALSGNEIQTLYSE